MVVQQSDRETEKDKRLLVLFLFGILLLFFDYIPPQEAFFLKSGAGCPEKSDAVSTHLPDFGELSPRLAFFYNQPMAINRASLQDLTLIPGIGEQIAGRIVSFRERNGYFRNTDDLELIPGIGRKMSSRISGFVSFM